jgi:hypothetical protein
MADRAKRLPACGIAPRGKPNFRIQMAVVLDPGPVKRATD